ncbi:MAG: hypothetical protein E6Q31_08570 [Aquabacterium sp.]|nr:MAG: hypothetical protein E6Q31_08570 [Aquabacterium sp.]
MTSRQRTWLGLAGGSSLLIFLTWFAWGLLSSGWSSHSLAAVADDGLQQVAIEAPPYVKVEFMFNDGVPRALNQAGGLFVQYAHQSVAPGREAVLTFTLRNDSSVVANAGFFLSRQTVQVQSGKHHRLVAMVTSDASDQRSEVGLGFHLLGPEGQYVSEYVPGSAIAVWRHVAEQTLMADYVDDGSGLYRGRPVGFLAPRFSVINIAPGAQVTVRAQWQALSIFADRQVNGVVWGDQVPVHRVGPQGMLHVAVSGRGLPSQGGDWTSELHLVNTQGISVHSLKRTSAMWSHTGDVIDSWAVPVPQSLMPGDYSLEFGLTAPEGTGASLQGDRGATNVPGGRVRVGRVRVEEAATGMWVGMSFHRYPGESESTLGPVAVDYQFARSLAADGMSGMQWWLGEDEYRWAQVDAWADFHARSGRQLLLVLSGSPTWASSMPTQPSAMSIPGLAAPPAQKYWPAYARMVEATVKRLKGRLLAVECWNEPDLVGGFTGTATQLADLCKLVSTRAKAVEAGLKVICPQPESPDGLPFVLGAKTSTGEPITNYCDYVGAHVYGAMGEDPSGRLYDERSVAASVARMRTFMAQYGVAKPLAVTEYGIAGCGARPASGWAVDFGRMPSDDAGEALYRSVRAFRQAEVALLGLYSYDHLDRNPTCLPGGSFLRTMKVDQGGVQQPDHVVLRRINDAVRDFGLPLLP